MVKEGLSLQRKESAENPNIALLSRSEQLSAGVRVNDSGPPQRV